MRVNEVKSAGLGCEIMAPGMRADNSIGYGQGMVSHAFGRALTANSDDRPAVTAFQRELLMLPDDVIESCNKTGRTPQGMYLIYLPKAYYDKKNDRYVDFFELANESQKNTFLYNKHKYRSDAGFTSYIPEGYEMKRIYGRVSIVNSENEALIRQRNSGAMYARSAIAAMFVGMLTFTGYKLFQYVKNIK